MLQARKLKTPRTIFALMLREMVTTYGRSPGGYAWAVLEPVAAIALLSVVFSLALRAPSLGTSFPLFYATGYLPFALYTDINNKIARSIQFSRPLLKYPRVTFIDAIAARFATNVLTHIAVFITLMVAINLTLNVQVILDVPSILLSLAMAGILGLGVGCINSYLIPAFPLWEQFWSIVTRPLFIVSTVIFAFEDVPAEYRDYLWFNPLIHIVGAMRKGFYATYDATYVTPEYVFGISLVLMMFGLLLLRKHHRSILNNEL